MRLSRACRLIPLVSVTTLAAACGSSTPVAQPTPTPAPTYHAAVDVFYDENDNGVRDSGETAVVPNVTLSIGGKTGVSVPATGRVELDGVAGGSDPVTVSQLPAFYAPGQPVSLSVPQPSGIEFYVPVTLPIGNNIPGLYMGFGDSITDGDGSFDENGWRTILAPMLQGFFGQGTINNQGADATRSNDGAARIDNSLDSTSPAYILVMYGTNDWNDSECRDAFPCYTIDSLRTIIEAAKARHTLPIISTIIPCNTGFDERAPPERNVWIQDMNALIKTMAQQEGAVLVDNYAAFMAVPDFHTLFSDHIHPNDAGYQIMAKGWFGGITQPITTTSSREALPQMPPHGRYYGSPGRVIGPHEE